MQYELALELKNAGFPQGGDGKEVGPLDTEGTELPPLEYLYVPTLEELIEACGVGALELWRQDDEWAARIFLISDTVTGATPTEAVAMLYLALHGRNRKDTPRVEGK